MQENQLFHYLIGERDQLEDTPGVTRQSLWRNQLRGKASQL